MHAPVFTAGECMLSARAWPACVIDASFQGQVEAAERIASGETPDVEGIVDASVAAIVRRCLEADPLLRPTSAEVAAAMQV